MPAELDFMDFALKLKSDGDSSHIYKLPDGRLLKAYRRQRYGDFIDHGEDFSDDDDAIVRAHYRAELNKYGSVGS